MYCTTQTHLLVRFWLYLSALLIRRPRNLLRPRLIRVKRRLLRVRRRVVASAALAVFRALRVQTVLILRILPREVVRGRAVEPADGRDLGAGRTRRSETVGRSHEAAEGLV